MNFITGKDRDQLEIFSLNQVISEENEVRLIDLFLQAVDLADFGFKMEFIELRRIMNLMVQKSTQKVPKRTCSHFFDSYKLF